MTKVFLADRKPKHRYLVEWQGRVINDWHEDANYRTYLVARWHVWVWNSLGYNARIIDTKANGGD